MCMCSGMTIGTGNGGLAFPLSPIYTCLILCRVEPQVLFTCAITKVNRSSCNFYLSCLHLSAACEFTSAFSKCCLFGTSDVNIYSCILKHCALGAETEVCFIRMLRGSRACSALSAGTDARHTCM